MFLRSKPRLKDGKIHRYWSIVENRRVAGHRVVQRQVLYLGELNDSQQAAWCKTIEVVQAEHPQPVQVALFPDDRDAPTLDCAVIQVQVSGLRVCHPRQWGACWLACTLWDQLELDGFWADKLKPSRKGTRWLNVLKTLAVYRLASPVVSGGCLGNGMNAVLWAIYWVKILVWYKFKSCTAASTRYCPTKRRCSLF